MPGNTLKPQSTSLLNVVSDLGHSKQIGHSSFVEMIRSWTDLKTKILHFLEVLLQLDSKARRKTKVVNVE